MDYKLTISSTESYTIPGAHAPPGGFGLDEAPTFGLDEAPARGGA
jgi:hypothetical protein